MLIVAGPDAGREFVVADGAARLGRSSSNDIVLQDPAMSRFHCRFFFKPGEGLWAEDLGSANQTLLNQQPLHVARLHTGDILTIGATEIRVVNDQPAELAPQNLFAAPVPAAAPSGGTGTRGRGKIAALAACLLILFAVLWVVYAILGNGLRPPPSGGPPAPADAATGALEIEYEKVQGSPRNIFRYALQLRGQELSVQIDDLENSRHVPGTQRKKIDAEVVRRLTEEIQRSGFFEMQHEYRGLATNVWDQWDLRITAGRRTGRVRVLNVLEPDAFRRLRELLEEFGQNELGLAALALTPDKLRELAQSAFLQGRGLYDQRLVKNENLALAIRALRETEWYLETIQPKPDFYADAVTLLETAKRELDEVIKNHEFLAERAMKLKDWTEAANQLRTICDRIPDRADERHARARRRLIDVERNLKRK